MAGDWIKMRTDLYRDPKVIAIAAKLMEPGSSLDRHVSQVNQCDMSVTRNVMRNVTVGALVTVWGVTRHQGKRNGDDSVLERTTLDVIDDLVDIPGFGSALASVGWVIEEANSLRFPRFFEIHNIDPLEDQREKNRERQRRFRSKNSNVTVTLKSNGRERGREREEKRVIDKSITKRGGTTPRPSLEEVRQYCQERGNAVDPEHFIDHYTANGWKQSNGNAIRDWRAAVRTWEKREFSQGAKPKEIF